MKLDKMTDGIYHIRGKDQYDITSIFLRIQEFYESPFRGIRGKHFTLEHYMDLYAKEYGNFTYCQDWVGFNVPGNVVRRFFKIFEEDLLDKEELLYQTIEEIVESKKRFYLIGTYQDGAVVDHELAHAFYYLDSEYKKTMKRIILSLPEKIKDDMLKAITDKGYCKMVLEDELQAYCSTSSMIELTEQFEGISIPWEFVLDFKKTFADAKDGKLGGDE
jgi:hypothetical protein